MSTPVQDRGPVHAKMAAHQLEECITLLSELMREVGAISGRKESVPEWIHNLDIDKLLDYNSALSILGMVVPHMRLGMFLRDSEELKAAGERMKAREKAQRAAIVQSGGHDAL